MQEQLNYVAALQSKNDLKARMKALIAEQEAQLANADLQIKQAHHALSKSIANQIAIRLGADSNFMTRLVQHVFGFEKVLNNLEPLKFQLHFHVKEMKALREVFKLMEDKGLIEIDHIFTDNEGKRFLVNSFLPDIKRNIEVGRYINPLTNEQMAKHIFHRHYFMIVHTTQKYLNWVEAAQVRVDEPIAMPTPVQHQEDHYKAVA